MILQITEKILTAMLAHGRREEPNEACGYLAARDEVVSRHFEMSNIDAAPDHYTMDPTEQFAVMRQMRDEGLEIIGVYHSHPATPARPSIEDLRLAHDPKMIYVIVSLLAGVEPVRAFQIRQGRDVEIPLQILDNRSFLR